MPRSRWRLEDVLAACDWLEPLTPSGLGRLFDRLGIRYKRGRDYVHSPDPDYEPKLVRVQAAVRAARTAPDQVVALFQDELTYYRQPTLARAWEARGRSQPRAVRSHQSNTATRVAATLDALTGQVCFWQGSRFGIAQVVAFYEQIRAAYPWAARIYVIQDNWPIHFHPDVLVALEPQERPGPWYRPPSWSEAPSAAAVRRWGDLQLPIQLVPLPTYASWTNPIEKLWRQGKQEVLHLHRLAARLPALRQELAAFLTQFAHGSLELLHYVGLPLPA